MCEGSPSSTEGLVLGRRGALSSFLLLTAPGICAADGPPPDTTSLNRELLDKGTNPFNSACMGFGCGDSNGLNYGGSEKPEGEASIDYKDFLQAIEEKKVLRVEFLPPSGDIAFATMKDMETPIRIGAGFPEEQSKGWGSPMYVMRILDNKGVPYKFKFEKKPYTGYQKFPKYEPPARSSKEFIPNDY